MSMLKNYMDKQGRTSCWDHRDRYWACLDEYAPNFNRNNEDENEPSECAKLRRNFVNGCPSQWIRHFDRKRTFEQFKKRMERGDFDPVKQEDETKQK